MSPAPAALSDKSRLAVLLERFAAMDDPRDVRRITHPVTEAPLLVVCGAIADRDSDDHVAAWGEAHLDFPRRHLPYPDGVPKSITLRRKSPDGHQHTLTTFATTGSRDIGFATLGPAPRRIDLARSSD